MDNLERFKAVCAGERPDYVPIFGFLGAPGMSQGAMRKTHERLVETGMPPWVDGCHSLAKLDSVEEWFRYWGTTGPIEPDFFPAEPARGIERVKRIEGEFEIIESETGAITRQVVDNDVTYSMPHFMVYDVRDRPSWEFYRERATPGPVWPPGRIEDECRRFEGRSRPLAMSVGSTWGQLRNLMGPEAASTVLYDDPELAHEIIDFFCGLREQYVFPLIDRLRPEIVMAGEDCCYNHGMLISPEHFEEFCGSYYRKVGRLAADCGVHMAAIDTDGNAMEFAPLAASYGVNALFPLEVKAENDLFALRERQPSFIWMGWLEKECVNEGNEERIEPEIMSKVPPLLERGRYFPNGDHGLQPLVTFDNMCRFMTLLHEVTGNPEGEFPRVDGAS
jgi:hypothetical protein